MLPRSVAARSHLAYDGNGDHIRICSRRRASPRRRRRGEEMKSRRQSSGRAHVNRRGGAREPEMAVGDRTAIGRTRRRTVGWRTATTGRRGGGAPAGEKRRIHHRRRRVDRRSAAASPSPAAAVVHGSRAAAPTISPLSLSISSVIHRSKKPKLRFLINICHIAT